MPSPLATEILRESLDRHIVACVEQARHPSIQNDALVRSTYEDYIKRLEQMIDYRVEQALRQRRL